LGLGQLGTDAFRSVDAGAIGQLVIHQHDVGCVHASSRDRLFDGPGGADDDDVVFLLEGAHDALGEHRVVVGHHDGDLAFGSHKPPLFAGEYHRLFGRTGLPSRALGEGAAALGTDAEQVLHARDAVQAGDERPHDAHVALAHDLAFDQYGAAVDVDVDAVLGRR